MENLLEVSRPLLLTSHIYLVVQLLVIDRLLNAAVDTDWFWEIRIAHP